MLAFELSSEEFSCQRVQSQTCLSYAECSRKSLVCKMYEIVNKQVFLSSQYVCTCKSAYTKGLCPKLSTNAEKNGQLLVCSLKEEQRVKEFGK